MTGIPRFDRYVGIDYSGAQTPISSLKGLRVYVADRNAPPVEVNPPPSPRKYWTRRGIASWLAEELSGGRLTLVGIDHGFSFPMAYFQEHHLALDWTDFLDDFQRHWPPTRTTSTSILCGMASAAAPWLVLATHVGGA